MTSASIGRFHLLLLLQQFDPLFQLRLPLAHLLKFHPFISQLAFLPSLSYAFIDHGGGP